MHCALLDLPEPGVLLSTLLGLVPDILARVRPGGCEELQVWWQLFLSPSPEQEPTLAHYYNLHQSLPNQLTVKVMKLLPASKPEPDLHL